LQGEAAIRHVGGLVAFHPAAVPEVAAAGNQLFPRGCRLDLPGGLALAPLPPLQAPVEARLGAVYPERID